MIKVKIYMNNEMLCSRKLILVNRLNNNILTKWQTSAAMECVEKKIQSFLLKSRLEIKNDEGTKDVILTVENANKASDKFAYQNKTINFNTIYNNKKWEHNGIYVEYINSSILTVFSDKKYQEFWRIGGSGLNALWVEVPNNKNKKNRQVITTSNNLSLTINFQDRLLLQKTLWLEYFSYNGLKNFQYINTGKDTIGWEFLDWYILPLINDIITTEYNPDNSYDIALPNGYMKRDDGLSQLVCDHCDNV